MARTGSPGIWRVTRNTGPVIAGRIDSQADWRAFVRWLHPKVETSGLHPIGTVRLNCLADATSAASGMR